MSRSSASATALLAREQRRFIDEHPETVTTTQQVQSLLDHFDEFLHELS